MPKPVFDRIKSKLEVFSKNVRRLGKTKDRKEKLSKEFCALQSGQYPPGVRPFNLSFECESLDQICGIRAEELQFNIKPNSTFREVKKQLHLQYTAFQRALDLKVMERQIEHLVQATSYEQFLKDCEEPGSEHTDALMQLGISLPPGLFDVNNEVTKAKSTVLYVNTVNALAREKQVESQKQEHLQKKKDQLVKEVLQRSPKDQFAAAVRQVMQERPPKKPDSRIDHVALQTGADPLSTVGVSATPGSSKMNKAGNNKRTKTKSEMSARKSFKFSAWNQNQGNGNSPGGGLGLTYKAQKGKGKGKGNTLAPKGKSKGKGKNQGKYQSKSTQSQPILGTQAEKGKNSKGKGRGGNKGSGKGKWIQK